jgi:hypothetical protein
MRKREFRYWNGKEMFYVTFKELLEDGYKVGNLETLMEFTGLTDKNNVKIFEGDVMKGYGATMVVFFNASTASFDVEYPETHECESLHENIELLTVVGNKYMNQELLKQE